MGVYIVLQRYCQWVLGILCLVACSLSPSTGAAESFARPALTRVDVPDIESIGGIFAIAQDPQGYLWFGGKNGLRRYDGYRVERFRHNPDDSDSLSNNDISDLFVDSKGRLWIAMLSGGGMDRYDFVSQKFIHYRHDPHNPHSIGAKNVYAFAEDAEGDLWFATHENGLNRLEHSTGLIHRYPKQMLGLNEDSVRDLAIDRFGNIWAATANGGLHRINFKRNEFYHYVHDPNDPSSISDNQLFRVHIDRYDNVWVGTLKGGLNRFDRNTGAFTRFQHDVKKAASLGSGMVWDIAEDSVGDIWVATGNGALNRFNKWQNQFDRFYPDEYSPSALAGTVIRLFLDSAGDFWMGTYNNRLNRLTERGAQFEVLRHSPNVPQSLLSSGILALVQDPSGKIWVASDKGLSLYDRRAGTYQHFSHDPERVGSLPKAPIRALAVEGNGRLWIGTNGQGVWTKEPGATFFQQPLAKDGSALNDDKIWSLMTGKNERIWIGTQQGGLNWFDTKEQSFGAYQYSEANSNSLSNEYVWNSLEDSKGRLWVATQLGLSLRTDAVGTFKNYKAKEQVDGWLSDSSIHALTEDAEGNLWVGTTSGLNYFNIEQQTFEVFRVTEGLADDSISAIVLDELGYVWVATQHGISRLDPNTKALRNYDTRHGIASNSNPRHSTAIRLSGGELLFGSVAGITVINPFAIRDNLFVPPVVLTDFYVNNKKEFVGGSVLNRPIDFTDKVTLNYEQNVFSIEFAALNFLVPEQNQYQYKLSGFDRNWQISDARTRRATYTNLNPGRYTFLVKGANNEGVWNDVPKQLQVWIRPPWWGSGPAYLCYAIIAVAGLYLLFRIQQQRVHATERLNRKLTELDKLKDQFLKNLSHDLRTPLNTIIGLCENVLDGGVGQLSDKTFQHVKIIGDNGQKLIRLVDDMLDFTVANQETAALNCRYIDIETVIDRSVHWFQPYAEDKDLKLYQTITHDLPQIWADSNRIQQILFYLIDNAIKYTRHGYVEVVAFSDAVNLTIQIADTGIGISDEQLATLFDGNLWPGGERGNGGNGIGLSRAKQLVQLHHGQLLVESKPFKGSVFTVIVPIFPVTETAS